MSETLHFRLPAIARQQGINTYYGLAKHCGVAIGTAEVWWNNKLKTYPRDVLMLLCRKLNCTPGDLLVYEPDATDGD